MTFTKSFPIKFNPVANPDAMITRGQARFSILTPRLLRLEYSPTGEFEDRPSQAFWMRNQPVPDFSVEGDTDRLLLETAYLQLEYQSEDVGFSSHTLTVKLKETGAVWHFGSVDPLNLRGTARTLDNVDGALVLEEGLLSRNGYAVYDDSEHLIFNNDGWLEPRNAPDGYVDLYFFGYGQDAAGCLADFSAVADPTPMVPRWALGNWWSRYWAYSDKELLALMDEFKTNQVPLSVCIVDMDWHITETGNSSSGWTGYTWNRELFPNPKAFIAALHKRGLRTALNLHPAEGVHPHEEQYAALAKDLGIDPASEEPLKFDISETTFAEAYFKRLHHPKEADGVDFWWMDWQQGTLSGLPGLDPLWWLNHLHFYDLGRNEDRRPFIFSRWGGLGNHRYPIGFSGDAIVTWDSLAFQPFFTATAANVNYGWWSHDIGGHMGGVEDSELYARWVQFGVFSPIFRLHCTNNPFHERRPWGWDAETERVVSDAMRLRHQLIPYIYSMAWHNHTRHQPLVRPMYHEYPGLESAYHCPDQYLFGTELLIAPFITPKDKEVNLSRQAVWLPAGEWTNFSTGMRYEGDGWYAVYGDLDDIPVFARSGAILPLAAEDGLSNPEEMVVHIFPGEDNTFTIYEDDGLKSFSLTKIEQHWQDTKWTVRVKGAEGETGHLPKVRSWTLCFRGSTADVDISANVDIETSYDEKTTCFCVCTRQVPIGKELEITLSKENGGFLSENDRLLKTCQKLVSAYRMESRAKHELYELLSEMIAKPDLMANYILKLTRSQLRALAETILDAGCQYGHTRQSQDEMVVLWNNLGNKNVNCKLAAIDMNNQAISESKALPKFAVFTVSNTAITYQSGNQAIHGNISIPVWFESLPEKISMSSFRDDLSIQFILTGDNSHSAYFVQKDGNTSLKQGRQLGADMTITADRLDWLSMINGENAPETMFLQGKIAIAGNAELAMQLAEMIKITPPGRYRPDPWQVEIDYLNIIRLSLDEIKGNDHQ